MNPEDKKNVYKPQEPVKSAFVEEPIPVVQKTQRANSEAQGSDVQPIVVKSDLDASISQRVIAQPKSLDEILLHAEDVVRDPNKHRLSLPVEMEKYTDKFKFYWVYKNKRAIDEALDVRGWVLATRMYFKDEPDHLWTINGTIERGDAILAFMPKKKAEMYIKHAQDRSTELLRANLKKSQTNPSFYKPTLSKEEEDTSNPTGLTEGRDF